MKLENIKPHPVVCRQSSISCAYACKRKWFLKYRLGVVLRGEQVKEGATLGKIYHRFQQLGPGHEDEVSKWVRQQQAALMTRVDKGEDLDGSMVRLANLMTELYHKAKVMFDLFNEKYPQPSYLRGVGTELKISMEYHGLIVAGTIDKLLENEQDGKFWIRDHKSTSLPLESIFGGIAWSIQARIYRMLANEYLHNNQKKVSGFIFDGILKPGIKLCRTDEKNANTWKCSLEDAYLRRVRDWYHDKEQEKEGATILSRSIIYNEPEIPPELEIALDLMLELSMMDISFEERDLNLNYPRDITREACNKYQKQCIYHDLCDSSMWKWDELFENKYKIEELLEEDEKNEDEKDTV